MDYNQMNYGMQYQSPMLLQTPEQRQMGLFLHLSQLLGPIIPIVIWQIKKDEIPALDAHGKMILNWIISSIIYCAVSAVLCLILIGFLGLIAIGIMGLVFPITGAIKANNGELWQYPLTIKFLK